MTTKSAEETMIALRSALSECMETYEFVQAIIEGDKSVIFALQGDWYITYVHNKNVSEDALIVDLPMLTDEILQQYEEIEAVDKQDRDAFISAIRESGCINELQEVMYERFQVCITERTQLMADRLATGLTNSPYIIRPIDWQGAGLEARVIVNSVDLGDLLTLYRHLQDEDDFLKWLQGQLKDAKPTIPELAQHLHRLYCIAHGKMRTADAWAMTEIASLWEDLGEERQSFFLLYAKAVRGEN